MYTMRLNCIHLSVRVKLQNSILKNPYLKVHFKLTPSLQEHKHWQFATVAAKKITLFHYLAMASVQPSLITVLGEGQHETLGP